MVAATRGGGGGGGEVVQVHGGHIIRSTAGKKDRHSKVYTAKGPRDRRVRLAAHTAIQFYDIQDRLGYDRPSKAVDWLMEMAKDAINKLDRLPPFDPNANNCNSPDLAAEVDAPLETGLEEPMGFVGTAYPHRDLCLSLQSFQQGAGFEQEQAFPAGWSSENPAEMGRFSRLLSWSDGTGGERGPLQPSFNPQSSIRAWDELQARPQAHLEQHRFMEFCIPQETGGDSENVHEMMVAHHHRGTSNSMSTTTDSSH